MYYTFSVEKDGRWWWTSCFASLWQLVVAYLARGMWYKYIYIYSFLQVHTWSIKIAHGGQYFLGLRSTYVPRQLERSRGFLEGLGFLFSLYLVVFIYFLEIFVRVFDCCWINKAWPSLEREKKKTFLIGRRPLLSPLAYKTLFVVKSHRLQDS